MHIRSNKYLQGVTTCCALFFSSIAPLYASNHLSSPTGAQDRGANIADHWAFLDPNDNTQLVLILSTQGFIVSSEHFGEVIFDSNLRYRFVITHGNETTSNTNRPLLVIDGNSFANRAFHALLKSTGGVTTVFLASSKTPTHSANDRLVVIINESSHRAG